MANTGWTSTLGATPGKLAAVALLAAALVAVVLFQAGGSAGTVDTPRERGDVREVPRPPDPDSLAAPAAPLAASEVERRPFLEITLETAIAYDPFAPVPALAELVAASAAEFNRLEAAANEPDGRSRRIDQTVAALRDKGVQMILLGQDDELAIVGDRAIRVGDVIDGLEIISIHPQGITLSDQGAMSP